MIGDIISHIMVKQHSLGWQMTVAGNFKETDFFLRHSKLFIRPFWGTFKTKQLPNCDFQHRQKSVDFWVYTLYTLVWPDKNDDPYLYLQCWHQKPARLGRRRSSRLTSLRSEPEEIHLQAWWSRLEANDTEKKGCYLMWKHFLNIRLMMDML